MKLVNPFSKLFKPKGRPMRILSSTGKSDSDIIVIDMTREQFHQLITVASCARGAAEEVGTSWFSVEQLTKITNFFNALKNIKAVEKEAPQV